MLKLGLTGSIATGKSTVLEAFAAHGVSTFSADAAVHELYEGEAVAPLKRLFPAVIHGGKSRPCRPRRLDRRPSRGAAGGEAIVHPLVRDRIAAFLEAARQQGATLAVVDIPLLFESGHDYGLDAVAVTVVDAATQRARALARPGMTVEKLETILARQLPQAEKQRRANYVFDTARPLPETAAAVKALLEKLHAMPTGNR